MTELDKAPTPDQAEENAFFPSPYSLTQYTSSKTDFAGADYPKPYTDGKWKVLMIATDERYIPMKNGKMFSTGNHPVEMLLPVYHMDKAGFDIDVATLSGNPAKLEMWAMPREDEAVMSAYTKYLPKLREPMKLSEVLKNQLDDSDYIAVFIPGGHGVLAGIPQSEEVKKVLDWALAKDKHIITLCHGPASLLAASVGEKKEDYPFKGYQMCVFPDSLDEGANIEIGYMPGKLKWLVGESLQDLGVEIMNDGITGQTHKDKKLLTGDSPLASNNLGKLAAETLLAEVHQS